MVNDCGSSCALIVPEFEERDEFVQHQPRAQQVADGGAVVPRHAQQPGDGREDDAEDLLQRRRQPAQHGSVCTQPRIPLHHRDQRQERDQHAADVQRQLQAVARALRRRVDHVDRGLLELDVHACPRWPACPFRHEDLGQHDGGRRGHDHGGQQMLDLDVAIIT